jgi:hypothetical protein
MPESGNLRRIEATGKLGVSGVEGVVGYLGLVGADGGVSGVAAGEQTGDEAGKAKGSYFKETASGACGGQKGHELGSKVMHGDYELRQAYPGGIWDDNDSFGGLWKAEFGSRFAVDLD